MTAEIPDFTKLRETETIKFRIDEDLFEAAPEVGAGILEDVISIDEDLAALIGKDPSQASEQDLASLVAKTRRFQLQLTQFLDAVMLPESQRRFAERLRSTPQPIDTEQVKNVVQYLITRYSKGRPTEPSSPSTNGHGGTGTSSTAGQPAKA